MIRELRDRLLEHREDYDAARAAFDWPQLGEFNWALDWFDPLARGNEATGLLVVEQDGSAQELSFDALARRSDQLANWLRAQGVARGDRILLMLGNQIELWETMLAAMKLGAVVIPATTLLAEADLRDRIDRGNARHVVVRSRRRGQVRRRARRLLADRGRRRRRRLAPVRRRLPGAGGSSRPTARRTRPTRCCCTSRPARPRGRSSSSTRTPRIRSATSSTMYWLGLKPGDVHLNLSSPGWAKHAWSNFFAPWLAEATVAIFNYERFDAARAARRDRHPRDHDVLRAADRLADADPGRSRLA